MMNNNMLVLALACTCPCPSYVFTKSITDQPILTLSRSSSCLSFKVVHDKLRRSFTARCQLTAADTHCEISDGNWDNLGFGTLQTDYMYVMKCCRDHKFTDGAIQPLGNIQLNPASCLLNYGQGLIEGLKAYKKCDDSVLVFRPEEYALRMQMSAECMCMPAPTIEQFVEAIKSTVLANKRWVPPPNKGFLHIRPQLMGSGPVLSLSPATEFTFSITVTPVAKNFEGDLKPMDLLVETEVPRAASGVVGSVKAIGNYASIMKTLNRAKANGFSDVLYLDPTHRTYLGDTSTANVFIVKENIISTPVLQGTILPGITRKTVIDIAKSQGFKVEERLVAAEELFEADEVFCTGNDIGILPVGSITYQDKRVLFKDSGLGVVSEQLRTILDDIQMGASEDKWGWTVELK